MCSLNYWIGAVAREIGCAVEIVSFRAIDISATCKTVEAKQFAQTFQEITRKNGCFFTVEVIDDEQIRIS